MARLRRGVSRGRGIVVGLVVDIGARRYIYDNRLRSIAIIKELGMINRGEMVRR